MYLLHLLLCLVSVLHLAIAQDGLSLSDLSPEKEEVQNTILNLHNEARSSVIPPASNMLKMEWKSQAAELAQKIADQCKMTNSSADEREVDGRPCGENIFKSSNAVSWEDVVSEWIKEKANFLYGTGAIAPEDPVNSYIQVIWYNSYETGCGVAQCPSDEYFYVCLYCPLGYNPESSFAPYDEGSTCGQCQENCNEGLCTNPCRYYDKGDNCNSLQDQCSDEEVQTCEATCKCNNNEII